MKFLFDDGNQNVGRYGAPNLRLDGVLAVAQKLLDAKVLFDPFEEQFDLPTILVKRPAGRSNSPISGQVKLPHLNGL